MATAPPISPAAQTAAQDLVQLVRRLRSRLRALPAGDLTPAQSSVLLRLNRDGASSTTVLAIAEGVRPQSMTATLQGLDELGLITRSPDPEDGRRQIIALSRAGKARASADREGRHAWLARSMDERFTAKELRTINEALTLLDELTAP
jgi:DNA-binding MarR family transcriptional regulator